VPVSSEHPEYKDRKEDWEKCRDAFEGQGAIKHAGTKYLPKLSEQTNEDYQAYKTRALFYSITSKTISALVGMATTKHPVMKYPEELKPYFEDNSGVQFHELLSASLSENLLMGRYGVLVDRPVEGGPPTIAGYTAENVLNWRTDTQGNPVLVVLRENVIEQDEEDEFILESYTRYRVLRLVNGVYTQFIYDDDDKLVGPPIVPTNLGQTMDYIPFYMVNPYGIGFDMSKPPVLDIVDINISHYRTSADLEHGRHYTGLPVPVVSGVDSSTKLRIGSMVAWVLPDVHAKAYYLEFTGQGLVSLEKALSEKQSQLASLSARLIGQSSNGSEAADTVRLRYMSETASLAAVVRAVEALLNKVYRCLAKMDGLDPTTVMITMDKEFLDNRLSGANLREIVRAYLDGGLSKETLVYNLRRGDVISPDRTDSEETKALDDVKAEMMKTAASSAPKPVNQPGVKS
jgi:hypothetical protein